MVFHPVSNAKQRFAPRRWCVSGRCRSLLPLPRCAPGTSLRQAASWNWGMDGYGFGYRGFMDMNIYGVASKFGYGSARGDPDVWIGLDHLRFGMDRGYGSACGFRVWIGALYFDSQPYIYIYIWLFIFYYLYLSIIYYIAIFRSRFFLVLEVPKLGQKSCWLYGCEYFGCWRSPFLKSNHGIVCFNWYFNLRYTKKSRVLFFECSILTFCKCPILT